MAGGRDHDGGEGVAGKGEVGCARRGRAGVGGYGMRSRRWRAGGDEAYLTDLGVDHRARRTAGVHRGGEEDASRVSRRWGKIPPLLGR